MTPSLEQYPIAASWIKAKGSLRLSLATHNVRSFSTDPLVDVYIEATKKIKADIIGICETRRSREIFAKWRTGDEVFLGKAFDKEARTGGVGFIVRKNAIPFVKGCTIVSPRIVYDCTT